MKKKTTKKRKIDPNSPIGKLTVIKDFLPSPEDLMKEEDDLEKITIYLDHQVIEFFKKMAKINGTKYQKMMRTILKKYFEKYKDVA